MTMARLSSTVMINIVQKIARVWPDALVLLPVLSECTTIDTFHEHATQIVPSSTQLIQYFTKKYHDDEPLDSSTSGSAEELLREKEEFALRAIRDTDQYLSAMWLRLYLTQLLSENTDIPVVGQLRETLMGTEQKFTCRVTRSFELSQKMERKRVSLADYHHNGQSHKRMCMGTETVLYKIQLKELCDHAMLVTLNYMTVAQTPRFDLDGWLFVSQPTSPLLSFYDHSLTLQSIDNLEQQQRLAIMDAYTQVLLFNAEMLRLYERLSGHQKSFRMCTFYGRFSTFEQCVITNHLLHTYHVLGIMLLFGIYCTNSNNCPTEYRMSIRTFNTALLRASSC